MFIKTGYNFGHIGQAIALAARAAAVRGEHFLAKKLIMPTLGALYDGFLTSDLDRTKLDGEGRLVMVPAGASSDRKQRYRDIGGEDQCLAAPGPYNQGVQVARAAIAILRALDAIDWKTVGFAMKEWTLMECRWRINEFILQNAKWLRGAFMEGKPTGESGKIDKYPGPDGVPWFKWKYRDLSACEVYQDTAMDRFQDIVHAKHELDFIADYRKVAAEGLLTPPRCGGADSLHFFGKEVIHRLLVTFLNRIVFEYGAAARQRFACDVFGIHDSSDDPHEWKSCKGSRKKLVRPKAAAGWLSLAVAAKDELDEEGTNPLMRCDALRMVDTVLPLALYGTDEFASRSFEGVDGTWAPDVIETKFHFYNYKKAMIGACAAFSNITSTTNGTLTNTTNEVLVLSDESP